MPELRRLLRGWAFTCAEYERCVAGDFVCDYHERAQIGFLAAAAWRSGGVALEEWRTEKTNPLNAARNGRGDLWVQMKGLCAHFEAKHARIVISVRVAEAARAARSRLRVAQCDVCDLRCGPGERRLGVLFVAPTISRKHQHQAESLLGAWLNGLREQKLNFAFAFKSTWPVIPRGSDDITPGIALLVGRARRAPSA
jgi:hypothetical protein